MVIDSGKRKSVAQEAMTGTEDWASWTNTLNFSSKRDHLERTRELLCTIVITTELKMWCLKQEMRTKELQP